MNIKLNRDMIVKIGIGLAAVIVVLWLVSLAAQLLSTLVPFAIAALVIFGLYTVLTRDSEKEQKEEQTITDTVNEGAARMVVSQIGKGIGNAIKENLSKAKEDEVPETSRIAVDEVSEEEEAKTVDALSITADDLDQLVAKPINLSRLEEKENKKTQITDDVRAQIEERRKRLMSGGES